MTITANMVKDLREKTGVGMMDCKKALQESDGDMEKAVEWLRKKGLSRAAKRADRATSNGVIGSFAGADGKSAAFVELNCETDFVAKNEDFLVMANQLAQHVAQTGTDDAEKILEEKFSVDPSKTVNDLMAEAIAKIGESLKIGKILNLKTAENFIGYYIHTGASALGLVEISGGAGKDLKELGHNIGMHIVAARPQYLVPDDVPKETLDKEIEIYKEEARTSGKPENILEKIALGKVSKFYSDVCLIKQPYVKDPQGKTSIEQLLKEHGAGLVRFVRMSVGE